MPHRTGHSPDRLPVGCRACPIREQTICQPLKGDALQIVEAFKSRDTILPAGSHLYRQGESCSKLYNLLSGWVVVYRTLSSGRTQILDFALPGRFLGYQPDLHGPMPHTAECLTAVKVCVFPRRQFPRLIEQNPALAVRLSWLISRDALEAQEHLINIGARSARARVAHLLLNLSLRLRHHQLLPSDQVIEIPLTQSHIADALGLTNVYVSQTLKQLREQGLLLFKNRQLQILDLLGLAEIADLDELLAV